MKSEMLEYTKTILRKVSFDKDLFEKELKKAISYLCLPELKELENWILKTFGMHYELIPVAVKN